MGIEPTHDNQCRNTVLKTGRHTSYLSASISIIVDNLQSTLQCHYSELPIISQADFIINYGATL